MRVADSLIDLIGGTPLVRLSCLGRGLTAEVLGKLESNNPLGSVKDRIAWAMIHDAEERGLLEPGGVVLEPTSGNTGIGLAFVCAIRGYRLILTMPETMSVERRKILSALGAEIVLTPPPRGCPGRCGPPGPHRIQGIGAGFVPKVLQRELIDEVITVTDEKAAETTRRLAGRRGSWLGSHPGRRWPLP
jgi:cysteine synthase